VIISHKVAKDAKLGKQHSSYMKNKTPLLLSAFLCFLATTLFLGCSSMARDVARYKGDGTIHCYEDDPYGGFFDTDHWFELDLPSMDLCKAEEKTYSLEGIPTSNPIRVHLNLWPSEGQSIHGYHAVITLRIIAKNGFVAFAQERRAELNYDGNDQYQWWSGCFYTLGPITLKADEEYRIEVKYHPEGTTLPSGKVDLFLEGGTPWWEKNSPGSSDEQV